MKAKVLKKFIDKNTGKVCNANKVITVTKDRFVEINATGNEKGIGNLLEEVVTEKKASK